MIKKGTMLNVKKGVGVLLALYIFSYFYQIEILNSLLNIPYLHLVVMGIASYFLIISGRRL